MTLGDVLSQYPSSIITAGVALAFLWLALYIYRVNPDDSVSKLASGAMITIFLYLLSDFMVSTATTKFQVILYQHALWWLPFAPVLWLHLSQKATHPLQLQGTISHWVGDALNALRSHATIGALYGCAALFLLAEAFTDSLFRFSDVQNAVLPLKSQSLPTGPVYILFVTFIFLTTFMAWINFLSQWWKESKKKIGEATFFKHGIYKLILTGIPFKRSSYRSQFWWLSLGGILFWAASAGLLIKSVTGINTGYAPGNITLGSGIIIVAIAILKYNALLNREALERDAIYTSIGALGIAIIYAIATFIGQGDILDVPIASLVLITTLALTTHMLADALKIWFSQLIGTRFGLFTSSDVDKMKQLYHEASRVKRRQEPAVELFNDGNKTVDHLLDLLTPRQREIITLRARGLSDKQIADALDIKLPTVRKHIEDIKTRIGSRDKADCAIYCVVTGLLSKDDLVDWFDSLNINDNNG
ncbi:MAG TPA: helix-turn-helix transcriptional regulator [Anaerolineae bacterium]|jgi:DNA-binding CsgD family transcriptional regulator|nr:helix-turn-helix transcriptional regulator [Anaerolineae bacterium]